MYAAYEDMIVPPRTEGKSYITMGFDAKLNDEIRRIYDNWSYSLLEELIENTETPLKAFNKWKTIGSHLLNLFKPYRELTFRYFGTDNLEELDKKMYLHIKKYYEKAANKLLGSKDFKELIKERKDLHQEAGLLINYLQKKIAETTIK